MRQASEFRESLRRRVLRIAAASAIGAVGGAAASCGPTTGHGSQCFAWPDADAGAAGAAGTAGGGGSAGASGSAGAAGASTAITCPSAEEATRHFSTDCKIVSIDGPPTVQNGECCYPTTTSCPALGRPFMVAGRTITAAARVADDRSRWGAALEPRVADLSDLARAALAQAWMNDALAEHASVAAFSRAALELMAVGAPSELIEGAHRAALDEIEHTRMCCALASAYAGRALEPGPFELGGAVAIGADLASVAASAVTEGCIGETLAAMQASEQLAVARDPAVRRALARIAEDEARHAELAYRIVAWALRTGDAEVRARVAGAFERVAASPPRADEPLCADVDLRAHGRLHAAAADDASSFAIADIVRPAAALLLASMPA